MARTTNAVKHTHQYFRRADGLWACSGIDDCTHFMPKNMSPQPIGRKSICWSCSGEFVLTINAMKHDQPRCGECGNTLDVIHEYLEEKGLHMDTFERIAMTAGKERPKETFAEYKARMDAPEVIEPETE